VIFLCILSFDGSKRKYNIKLAYYVKMGFVHFFCPALWDLRCAPTCTIETACPEFISGNQRKYSQNSLPRHFGDHSLRTWPTLPGLPAHSRFGEGRVFWRANAHHTTTQEDIKSALKRTPHDPNYNFREYKILSICYATFKRKRVA
jgi:hypothetical protein